MNDNWIRKIEVREVQPPQEKKNKSVFIFFVLAVLFSAFGLHRFYLGQKIGWLYLAFFWTIIPAMVGMFEAMIAVEWPYLISNRFKETND